jgi:hypothetical protein
VKIRNVYVEDRRARGIIERPRLEVNLEEPLFPGTDELTYTPSGVRWKTQRYGPFVHYSVTPKNRATAGHYNIAFRDLFPPIVDVDITIGDFRDQMEGHFGLPLKRARQILRQWELPWRLLLNDYDGQHGLLTWTPVERHPICKYSVSDALGDFVCERDAVQVTVLNGVEIPFCAEHLSVHNSNQRAARQARTTSR